MTWLVLIALGVIALRFTAPALWTRYTDWRWRRFRRSLVVRDVWDPSQREGRRSA